MRTENSVIISSIKSKINEMSSLNKTLRAEVQALEGVVKRLNNELEVKTREVSELNQKLENVDQNQGSKSQQRPALDLTTKIDGMVKEIDRCIALLNN
jgi:outer membrane murein-binding lipoprotein Lpp